MLSPWPVQPRGPPGAPPGQMWARPDPGAPHTGARFSLTPASSPRGHRHSSGEIDQTPRVSPLCPAVHQGHLRAQCQALGLRPTLGGFQCWAVGPRSPSLALCVQDRSCAGTGQRRGPTALRSPWRAGAQRQHARGGPDPSKSPRGGGLMSGTSVLCPLQLPGVAQVCFLGP